MTSEVYDVVLSQNPLHWYAQRSDMMDFGLRRQHHSDLTHRPDDVGMQQLTSVGVGDCVVMTELL